MRRSGVARVSYCALNRRERRAGESGALPAREPPFNVSITRSREPAEAESSARAGEIEFGVPLGRRRPDASEKQAGMECDGDKDVRSSISTVISALRRKTPSARLRRGTMRW